MTGLPKASERLRIAELQKLEGTSRDHLEVPYNSYTGRHPNGS